MVIVLMVSDKRFKVPRETTREESWHLCRAVDEALSGFIDGEAIDITKLADASMDGYNRDAAERGVPPIQQRRAYRGCFAFHYGRRAKQMDDVLITGEAQDGLPPEIVQRLKGMREQLDISAVAQGGYFFPQVVDPVARTIAETTGHAELASVQDQRGFLDTC